MNKIFSQEYIAYWLVLLSAASILIILYGFEWKELLKKLFEWTFIGTGFILVEHGVINKLNNKAKKDNENTSQ